MSGVYVPGRGVAISLWVMGGMLAVMAAGLLGFLTLLWWVK